MEAATIISVTISTASGVIAAMIVVKAYLQVRNSKTITLTKKDRTQITIPTEYNKTDSKRHIDFINA